MMALRGSPEQNKRSKENGQKKQKNDNHSQHGTLNEPDGIQPRLHIRET